MLGPDQRARLKVVRYKKGSGLGIIVKALGLGFIETSIKEDEQNRIWILKLH